MERLRKMEGRRKTTEVRREERSQPILRPEKLHRRRGTEGTGTSSHEPPPAVQLSPGAFRGCGTRDKAMRGRPDNLRREQSYREYRVTLHTAEPALVSHNNRTPEILKYLSGEWKLNEGQPPSPPTFSDMKDPTP